MRFLLKPLTSNIGPEYINAKSVTLLQLFGAYDSISLDWADGLVSNVFRKFFDSSANECHKWIVFDGPIDSEWVENLNTVLDDDRKLCLSSGEAITLTPNTSVIFEVDSLSQASPATVSLEFHSAGAIFEYFSVADLSRWYNSHGSRHIGLANVGAVVD